MTKARRFSEALDEDLIGVCAIPDNRRYPQSNGWIEPGDAFEPRQIITTLHTQVVSIAPSASWESIRVDATATSGVIAKRLRERAVEREASGVVIESQPAGRFITTLTDVGSSITAGDKYDVLIVRRKLPPKLGGNRPKPGYYQ